MEQLPSVSVIVPIYNTEKFLRESLESLRAQTLRETEFICIDDGSTDGSREILMEYAGLDPRFKPVCFPENRGTSLARKEGTLLSAGRYVMYLDGDDAYTPETCAKALAAIEESGADMLQFGTEVIPAPGMPETDISGAEKLLNPYAGRLEGELVNSCFSEEKFGFTLWNKIYRGDLCRKAAAEVKDGRFLLGEDLYLFFLIAAQSESYAGISDKLYSYQFGAGITGAESMSDTVFEKLLTEKKVSDALYTYAEKEGLKEKYEPALTRIRDRFLDDCCSFWQQKLKLKLRQQGLNRLMEVWGVRDTFCKLAEQNWYEGDAILSEVKDLPRLQHKERASSGVKTVAAYYRNIKNGGAQRVVAMLASLWAEMRAEDGSYLYNVVLITDEDNSDIPEYPLHPRVQRAYLPPFREHAGEKFAARFDAWQDIITRYGIDIIVDSMWYSLFLSWDMLAIRSHPAAPAFVIHVHNTCTMPFHKTGPGTVRIALQCSASDGVITLSECDTRYYSVFCPNTRAIVNPFAPEIKPPDDTEDRAHTVVWVGRISPEKQPLDAVLMIRELLAVQPKARLLLVGSGDEELTETLKKRIKAEGLNDCITLTGFTAHPCDYYAKAGVFISTSQFEGFPLVHCEALSHGLPVVSYDMPYLSIMRDGRGIIPVPQGRWDLMAEKVSELMDDPAKMQALSRAAKAHAEDIRNADIAGAWREMFRSVDEPQSELLKNGPDQTDRILYRELLKSHKIALDVADDVRKKLKDENIRSKKEYEKLKVENEKQKNDHEKLKAEYARLKKECDDQIQQNRKIKQSKAYRLGHLLLWPFKKMLKCIKK